MKRLFDFFVALVILAAVAPLMLVTALVIRIELGSPVFFRQTRAGLRGKPFTIYKFRTMRDAWDAHGQALPDAVRLSRLGETLRRLSVDELPQLVCVLKGDMSLVGPRPLLLDYLPLYNSRQARRHEVRPGITGWAQVNGRNSISWEAKFEYDVWYVEHQSLALDLKILWRTFLRVLERQGVANAGHATMPRFTGSDRREI